MRPNKQGGCYAVIAFSIWGFFPLYFKSLEPISPLVVLACRIIWSAVLLVLLVVILRQSDAIFRVFKNKREFLLLSLTAVLIGINWGGYVWAINNNYIFEASLAYYINPLLNVFLGYLFLAERLRPMQWFAVALAVMGVSMETLAYNEVPWIALMLSGAFGAYGLLHKKMNVDSISGLSVEALLLMPMSLLYIIYLWQVEPLSISSPARWSWQEWFLLAAAGPITVVPLLLFTMAARRISLVSLGFFQYITPTILFLLAAFFYQQAYSPVKLFTFVFIWLGLIIMSIDAVMHHRRVRLDLVK